MTRRLFTVASLLSLLLCLATAVLWVRSYWIIEQLDVVNQRRYGLAPLRGSLFVEAWTSTRYMMDGYVLGPAPADRLPGEVVVPVSKTLRWRYVRPAAERPLPKHEFCGFGWSAENSRDADSLGIQTRYTITRGRIFVLPYWFV